MGFNKNTLSAALVEKVFRGLESEFQPLIKRISSDHRQVTALSGILPALTSASTLARSDMGGGIAPGATSKDIDMELENFTYNILRYPGSALIPDHIRIDLDGQGMKTMETYAKVAMAVAAHKMNVDLKALLTSTSLNETGVVNNGAWSSGSSTPFEDFNQAFNAIGDADVAVIGRNKRQDLQLHPDFIAETSNFSAGSIGAGDVAAILMRKYPHLKQVVVGDGLYNTANEGQSVSIGHLFDGVMWVGYSDSLVYVEQTGNTKSEVERKAKARSNEISYEESADQVRTTKEKGYVLTDS